MNNPRTSRLPAPAQLAISKMNPMEAAEMIEKHIEFFDRDAGRSVHLQPHFVSHYMRRNDGALPIISSVAQLPIVLPNGAMLRGRGLNRKYGIFFAIPEELDPYLPTLAGCTPGKVARTMRFLCDVWLVDVAATYHGKCKLIALALSIIEKALLPARPAFFVTAGQRGGGKTTAINMVSMAAAGQAAAAAAWSGQEEERRKALFAYLGSGLQMLVFDNIARGSVISCPSIEKALTTELYSDRILGESTNKTVPAYTIIVFTGNNVAPRGDLASRSLSVHLSVDRPDPENRPFTHPDPIAWTDAHRGEILGALYTLLLGNPRRRQTPECAGPGNDPL